MPPAISILPLGTCSATPTRTRNHSSLAIILPSSDTLIFDAGEGTQHQLQKFKSLKVSQISKIFITHLHGDHLYGLCPLLSSICNGHGGAIEGQEDPRLTDTGEASRPIKANIEIYGPKGLREFVRTTLKLTYTHLDAWIAIHELLFPHEEDTPSNLAVCYQKEVPGKNIRPDRYGFWRDIYTNDEFSISAGEIKHSVPCVGYVLVESTLPGKIPKEYPKILSSYHEYFRAQGITNPMTLLSALQSEKRAKDIPSTVLSERGIVLPDNSILPRPLSRPGRKITILGDTYDPSPIIPLAMHSTVLIHEATNAYLPGFDPNTKPTDTYMMIKEWTMSRGHSTPEMAGHFARSIYLGVSEAGHVVESILVLNHFSARYKDDEADGPGGEAEKVMEAIRYCANNAWHNGVEGSGLEGFGCAMVYADASKKRVISARDGVKIEVKVG